MKTVRAVTAFVLIGLPAAYYSYVEITRICIVRKRKSRYIKYRKERSADESREAKITVYKDLFGSVIIGGRFNNPFVEWREQGAWEWLFWKLIYTPLSGKLRYNGGIPADAEAMDKTLPSETPSCIQSASDLGTAASASSSNTFTWIGQSTNFVQLEGVNILTDPVFSSKTIDSILAPPRLRPPPCQLAELPQADIVLVSHNHFDHVHPEDVRYLGDSVQWIVPLGLGSFLESLGVTRYTELDWWQSTSVEGTRITATPAMHWSARSIQNTNQTLWCSFVVETQTKSYFHCGDTGFSHDLYEAIGDAFGPITLSTLPIGSYSPRWHLSCHHCDPEDAVKMHMLLRSQYTVGVHWGTWVMSDEHYLDPEKDLAAARTKLGVEEGAFQTLPFGRTVLLH